MRSSSIRRGKRPWLVVLAGGDGRRLAPLTQNLFGYNLAKQFAVIRGTRSPLQRTLVRLRAHVTPRRTVVVSTRKWAGAVAEQLQPHHGVEAMLQPMNLGSGVGALLAIACIRATEPDAVVMLVPGGHHVDRPELFDEALLDAARCVDGGEAPLIALGIEPDRFEVDHDWLIAGTATAAKSLVRRVEQVVERPDRDTAQSLFTSGGLWNSQSVVGSVEALWTLAERALPTHAFLLQLYASSSRGPGAEQLLARIFERMQAADLGRSLILQAPELAVRTVAACGWSDLATPERLLQSLRGTSSYDAVLYQLARPQLASA